MTKAKQTRSGTNKPVNAQQWASEVIAITDNAKQNGLEIRFDAEPSPQLQPKLRAMSFRHSRMKTMWYGDNTQQARDFAEQVKEALPNNQDGPQLWLQPSAEAVRTNIEKKEFSFVMITLKDGQSKNYVVFEPSKPKAEVIAMNFANQQFTDNFIALAALPKTHIKEARTLFDEGKIIFPNGEKMPVHRESVIKNETTQQPEMESKDEFDTPANRQRDLEVKALDKYYKWAVQQDDENVKPTKIKQEDLTSWLKESNPTFDDKAIERIWQSHQRILKSLSRVAKISSTKSTQQPYSSIYKKLLKVIPNLPEHIKAGIMHGKSSKDPEGGLMDLNYDFLSHDKHGNPIFALSHYYKQGGDMIADPDMQIRLMPDMEMAEALTFQDHFGFQQVYPEKDGKIYVNLKLKKSLNQFLNQWLTNIIHQGLRIDLVHDEEEKSEPLEEAQNDSQEEQQMPLVKAIATDLKVDDRHVPNVLVPAATQEPFYSQLWSLYDMKSVLKNNFPHLLEINSKNLDKASPIAMFELIQFAHPTDYGIKVNRMDLLNEWEKRGHTIFKALGFPTDDLYPYVNLYLGYESVEPLKEMLFENNKDGNEWWAIAEHSRPVADVKKGIKIINDRIAKEKREMKIYLNPATGKPKGEYKQQVKDVEFTIRHLEESKEVLQHYLNNEPEIKTEEEEIASDPLANENGVFTRKTAGNNFEEIEIPIPKSAQYEATIIIVKTSAGHYTYGLSAEKQFGDYNGMGFAASTAGQVYASREEALEVAIKQHETRLELLLTAKDNILDNEAKKNKQLNTALDALRKFAEENNITLDENAAQATSDSSTVIIKGLEAAYWNKDDNEYPVNKITIKGMKFNQARLREDIGAKLEKLPIATLEQIVVELSEKFEERRSLAQYEKGLVTIGKKGDKRKAILIAAYVDDMIIDNDLSNKRKPPVMTFLLELLFSSSPRMADLPQHIETSEPTPKPMKKQSQYDLNKEIEAFIDEKDKTGSHYNEEERTYLRQYTGSGGLLKQGAADRGALYEYYTPDEVVKKMWDIAYHFGYKSGKVCEPSVGTGNFLKYAPKNAIVYGFETNHYSARIAQILFPQAHIHEKAFESLFFAGNVHLKDKFENPGYSLIIGNPPYGEFTGKYAGMGEKQHTGATEYDQYFIVRGLDVLEPGGILVLLIPSTFMTNGFKYQKVKEKIAAKAELLDCYRLPGRIFETTDIGTDILVLKRK